MDRNVRLAKKLLRFARMLMAGYDTMEQDTQYFNENVANSSLPGFESQASDMEVTFIYSKDETGGCSIVFGEVDGDWGYTVNVNGDEFAQITKDTAQEAWETLSGRINTYISQMDSAIEARNEEMKVESVDNIGTCKLVEVGEDDAFRKEKSNAFNLALDPGTSQVYEATFTVNSGVDGRKLQKNLKGIKENIEIGMPVTWRRGGNVIKFQTINNADLDYAKDVITTAGWKLA